MHHFLLAILSLVNIVACTNLKEFSNLPTPNINAVTLNLTEQHFPKVQIEYCIANNLPADIELNKTNFKLYINEIFVDSANDSLTEITLEPNNKLCRRFNLKPDLKNNPNAASTIYQRMLDRTYRIETQLYFANKDVKNTSNSFHGVFKSNPNNIITTHKSYK